MKIHMAQGNMDDLTNEEKSQVDKDRKAHITREKTEGVMLNRSREYPSAGEAGDVLQELITALEAANIAIPAKVIKYRDDCQGVKSKFPKRR